jgi:hypothetical protein
MRFGARLRKQTGQPNEAGKGNEKSKGQKATDDLKVWCESCCLRVAPNEERTVAGGKTYHSRCYSKLSAKPK